MLLLYALLLYASATRFCCALLLHASAVRFCYMFASMSSPLPGVQSMMVAPNSLPVGVSTTEPPSVRGVRLSALKAASAVVRSLVRVTAAGLPSVKAMVAVSCCSAPAVPSSRTVAAHLPALAPSAISENVQRHASRVRRACRPPCPAMRQRPKA